MLNITSIIGLVEYNLSKLYSFDSYSKSQIADSLCFPQSSDQNLEVFLLPKVANFNSDISLKHDVLKSMYSSSHHLICL